MSDLLFIRFGGYTSDISAYSNSPRTSIYSRTRLSTPNQSLKVLDHQRIVNSKTYHCYYAQVNFVEVVSMKTHFVLR